MLFSNLAMCAILFFFLYLFNWSDHQALCLVNHKETKCEFHSMRSRISRRQSMTLNSAVFDNIKTCTLSVCHFENRKKIPIHLSRLGSDDSPGLQRVAMFFSSSSSFVGRGHVLDGKRAIRTCANFRGKKTICRFAGEEKKGLKMPRT